MQKNLMEFGRSMVEMLGVLAIIGVLSIVGIRGYKKAMISHQANELMNLGMMLYNETFAKAALAPGDKVIGEQPSADKKVLRAKFRLYLTESSAEDSTGLVGNMGVEPPSFINHPDFNIIAILSPTEDRSYINQYYHRLYFYGMNGNCDLCEGIKSLTQHVSKKAYRRIWGSQTEKLTTGIIVQCFQAGEGSTNCFKDTDTE